MSVLDARRLLDRLTARSGELTALLERFVTLESPSDDPASQRPLRDAIAAELDGVGLATRTVRGRGGVGDHLFARERRRGPPRQLVVGHFDTVWPLGSAAGAGPTDGALRGPGSFDMKGGLVQFLGAVRVLRELDVVLPVSLVVFFNSDEEIGSPDSRRWIEPLARRACRAFVLEAASGPDGALKVGRKGVGRYVVKVHGRAAHAGLDPSNGVSAVLELSHQVQRLFALNDPESGVTVNVGTIDGGLRPNVIAPEARAHVDVRTFTQADADAVDQAIRNLEPVTQGVTLEISGGFDRPPMERTSGTENLWQRAVAIAGELGLTLEATVVGGASDGNLTSQYTATLDGLGAVGDGAHRADEHVLLRAMPQRAALLAALLASDVDRENR